MHLQGAMKKCFYGSLLSFALLVLHFLNDFR